MLCIFIRMLMIHLKMTVGNGFTSLADSCGSFFHHWNQHVPFHYLSYYSKVTSVHSERRQQKIFLKSLHFFIIFFFVSLLPASSFKMVKLDVYGSVKVFVVQLTFSLVHVENNSTLEDICFSWPLFFWPFTLKTFKAKVLVGNQQRKILPFGLNPSELLWSTQ